MWFVLKYLLGYDKVHNYGGSWTEWGNAVRAQIERDSLSWDAACVTNSSLRPWWAGNDKESTGCVRYEELSVIGV
jgi:hypothetical protein